jgi:hypothetical protein
MKMLRGDNLAFNLGEPDLDLVEPKRLRGCEVKADARMLMDELADHRRLWAERLSRMM